MAALAMSLLVACHVSRNESLGGDVDSASAKSVLRVSLADGFIGESVIVQVNSREVFRGSDVMTRPQINRARAFEVDVPHGETRVDVSLPQRESTGQYTFDVNGPAYLTISVRMDGRIEFMVSESPAYDM